MIKFDPVKYYYDSEAAERVIRFIETMCQHVKGDYAGQLIKVANFWKEDIICPAFGIKRRDTGKRRFKTVYVEIGKGNAKSTIGSALALYMLGADGQQGAEVYSVAGDTSQARIIFDTAKFMVEQNVLLRKRYEPYQYSIIMPGTSNMYKVLSSEAHTKHGFIPSAIIFDELHVQPNRDLWDTLTAGQMKRSDSLCFAFTTAGSDKNSICYEIHQKAIKIKQGLLQEDSFLGIIYAAGEKDDISKVKTWKKANPGLGTIITEDNLRIEYNKVLAVPGYENTFRRLHLNQWTDVYESWISDIEWMKCESAITDLTAKECYGGLDLASTRDFNALVLLFPDGENCEIICYFWIPKERIDHRMETQNVNFRQWVNEDYIKELPGAAVDHTFIINDIKELAKQYQIKSIAYDRKFAAPIVGQLESEITMNPFDQSITNISYPTKELDKLVATKRINHRANPVLRWMLSNVAIFRDANDNIKVTKKNSQDKVDGIVALIMAIGEWVQFQMEGNQESVYETRGVITID